LTDNLSTAEWVAERRHECQRGTHECVRYMLTGDLLLGWLVRRS